MQANRNSRRPAAAAAIVVLGAVALGAGAANQAHAETGCAIDHQVVSSWNGGFQASVSITADEDIDGWEAGWDFPAGTAVQSAWDVDWSQSGASFSGADVGRNAAIASGQTSEVFGFIASGSAEEPTSVAVDGDPCDGRTDSSGAPADSQAPVSIMPLGDSITGSPGCWRGNLWALLDEAGHDLDFVGSQSQQCAPTGSDPDHEGHGGYLVTQSVENGDTRMWLEANTPDVLLMHFGTNDVWSAIPPARILDAYTAIVEDLRELNPDAIIMVAQIIPLHPDESFGCEECPQRAIDLNAEIPGWAAELTTERSPIVVVDQHTGFDPETDTTDGVHPDEDGYVKIAANWFAALEGVLSRR